MLTWAFSASLPKKTGQDLSLRFREGMTINKSKLCENQNDFSKRKTCYKMHVVLFHSKSTAIE